MLKAYDISRYSPATCFLFSSFNMIFTNVPIKARIVDFIPTSKLELMEEFTICEEFV